jgi:type IV secretion system protein VirB1
MGVVVLVAIALASLVQNCTRSVGPSTILAIVEHESSSHPYAIGDNTAHHAYYPRRYDEAVRLASDLVEREHDIDLGYMQVNIGTVRATGLDVARALDPCTNLKLGSEILRADYARAERRWGPGQGALARALSAYNSGGYERAQYARAVYFCAARLVRANASRTLAR